MRAWQAKRNHLLFNPFLSRSHCCPKPHRARVKVEGKVEGKAEVEAGVWEEAVAAAGVEWAEAEAAAPAAEVWAEDAQTNP
jgi:hypothetical protein